MIIGLLTILVGFGIIIYGAWKFMQFLFPSLRPKEKVEIVDTSNPWIEAHKLDDRLKQEYANYLKWAQENDKPVLFTYEAYQEKVARKQKEKINRLFK